MLNYKDTAEKYVREQLPELKELSFGCQWKDDEHGRLFLQLNGGDYKTEDAWANFVDDKGQITAIEMEERDGRTLKAIGHPIQLQHWLRVLPVSSLALYPKFNRASVIYYVHEMNFNLTTGQPDTENDYKAFCDIVGI